MQVRRKSMKSIVRKSMKSVTSQEVVNLVMREVFRHHGLPDDVISDHGPQFISKFWKHMFKHLWMSAKISTGYHLETNGRTERTNQNLEQYLHCFIKYQHDDWFFFVLGWIPLKQLNPFFYIQQLNTGCHPLWTMNAHLEVPTNPVAEDRLSRL